MIKNPEIRHDLISGNWVIISPRPGKKPHEFSKNGGRAKIPKKNCPFEAPLLGQKVIRFYGGMEKWREVLMENKYPAVVHGNRPFIKKSGAYELLRGFGHHNIIATRDHNASFPDLSSEDAVSVFRIFQNRYRELEKESEVAYISIFHNWGARAGASIYHPHYQIITVPIIPRSVEISLDNSHRFFLEEKRCMHCFVIRNELRGKKRVVFKNGTAVVVAPFVSREPFQLRVYPLRHRPYFEDTPDEELKDVALALRTALGKIDSKLRGPDYNFFLHTAPVLNKKKYSHYHWHIDVIPQFNVSAGFELGTGIEVNTVDPDEAARILRE
ncbi:DUF4931 domain-containing protein [bacterium]|nr:MAG: DUF4931 domain-containing protein [bacterium]